MVSKLTVEDDVRRKHVAIIAMKSELWSRPIVVDHLQKHHGAACRAMLRARETVFLASEIQLRSDPDARTYRPVADIVQCGLLTTSD
jgi:hypothetical protein